MIIFFPKMLKVLTATLTFILLSWFVFWFEISCSSTHDFIFIYSIVICFSIWTLVFFYLRFAFHSQNLLFDLVSYTLLCSSSCNLFSILVLHCSIFSLSWETWMPKRSIVSCLHQIVGSSFFLSWNSLHTFKFEIVINACCS